MIKKQLIFILLILIFILLYKIKRVKEGWGWLGSGGREVEKKPVEIPWRLNEKLKHFIDSYNLEQTPINYSYCSIDTSSDTNHCNELKKHLDVGAHPEYGNDAFIKKFNPSKHITIYGSNTHFSLSSTMQELFTIYFSGIPTKFVKSEYIDTQKKKFSYSFPEEGNLFYVWNVFFELNNKKTIWIEFMIQLDWLSDQDSKYNKLTEGKQKIDYVQANYIDHIAAKFIGKLPDTMLMIFLSTSGGGFQEPASDHPQLVFYLVAKGEEEQGYTFCRNQIWLRLWQTDGVLWKGDEYGNNMGRDEGFGAIWRLIFHEWGHNLENRQSFDTGKYGSSCGRLPDEYKVALLKDNCWASNYGYTSLSEEYAEMFVLWFGLQIYLMFLTYHNQYSDNHLLFNTILGSNKFIDKTKAKLYRSWQILKTGAIWYTYNAYRMYSEITGDQTIISKFIRACMLQKNKLTFFDKYRHTFFSGKESGLYVYSDDGKECTSFNKLKKLAADNVSDILTDTFNKITKSTHFKNLDKKNNNWGKEGAYKHNSVFTLSNCKNSNYKKYKPTVDIAVFYDLLLSKGKLYKGTVSKTESGFLCKSWSKKIKSDGKTGKYTGNTPLTEADKNYCRNPDGEDRPWCYLEGREKRWEHCDVLNTNKSSTDNSEIKILSKFIEKKKIQCLTNKKLCIGGVYTGPHLEMWTGKWDYFKPGSKLRSIFNTPTGTTCINIKESSVGTLKCSNNQIITKIKFASWGASIGENGCTNFEQNKLGECQQDVTDIVTNECLYEPGCVLMAETKSEKHYGLFPSARGCAEQRHLAVSVECGSTVKYDDPYKIKVVEYDEYPSYLDIVNNNIVKCSDEGNPDIHIAKSCSRCPYTKKSKGQIRREGVKPEKWCTGRDCVWSENNKKCININEEKEKRERERDREGESGNGGREREREGESGNGGRERARERESAREGETW